MGTAENAFRSESDDAGHSGRAGRMSPRFNEILSRCNSRQYARACLSSAKSRSHKPRMPRSAAEPWPVASAAGSNGVAIHSESENPAQQAVPVRDRMHMNELAVVLDGISEAAPVFDYGPDQRIPFPPDRFGFVLEKTADDLRDHPERLRHNVRQFAIPQYVPLGKAAHQGRTDRVNDAADAGFTYWKRAHHAGLDIGVDRAIR